MVKHTQTISGLLPTNCLSVFNLLVGLAFKGLIEIEIQSCIFESRENVITAMFSVKYVFFFCLSR